MGYQEKSGQNEERTILAILFFWLNMGMPPNWQLYKWANENHWIVRYCIFKTTPMLADDGNMDISYPKIGIMGQQSKLMFFQYLSMDDHNKLQLSF